VPGLGDNPPTLEMVAVFGLHPPAMFSHTQLPASSLQVQLQVPSSAQVGGEPQSIGPASPSDDTTTCSTQPVAIQAAHASDASRARFTRARRIPRYASTLLAGLSLVASLGVSRGALADDTHRYRLEWQRAAGAESCADGEAMLRRVVHHLGRDPFDENAERSIVGRVWRVDNVWRAEIELLFDGQRKGRRALSSGADDCATLDDALALAVALAIAPRDASPVPAPDTNAPGGGAKPVEPPSTAVVERPPLRSGSPSRPRAAVPVRPAPASLAAGALYLHGALPEPALGIEASGTVGLSEPFSAYLLAWHLPEQTDARGEHAFSLSALGLGACVGHRPTTALELELCPAMVAGSAVSVVKGGVHPVDPGAEPWLAGALVPRIRLRLVWQLSLELGAIAAASVVRPRFELAGGEEQGPAPVVLGSQLGLAVSNF
jgi:hypothetical protein